MAQTPSPVSPKLIQGLKLANSFVSRSTDLIRRVKKWQNKQLLVVISFVVSCMFRYKEIPVISEKMCNLFRNTHTHPLLGHLTLTCGDFGQPSPDVFVASVFEEIRSKNCVLVTCYLFYYKHVYMLVCSTVKMKQVRESVVLPAHDNKSTGAVCHDKCTIHCDCHYFAHQ